VRRGVEVGRRDRRQRIAAARDAPDRVEQHGGVGCLVDHAVGAGHAGDEVQRLVLIGGVEDHARGALERAQAPAGGQAVAVQQLVVEQHNVWTLAGHELEPVVRPRGGADRHEPRLAAQQQREPGADGGLWIDDGHARHGDRPSQPTLNLS
jgi:hypothetical protein